MAIYGIAGNKRTWEVETTTQGWKPHGMAAETVFACSARQRCGMNHASSRAMAFTHENTLADQQASTCLQGFGHFSVLLWSRSCGYSLKARNKTGRACVPAQKLTKCLACARRHRRPEASLFCVSIAKHHTTTSCPAMKLRICPPEQSPFSVPSSINVVLAECSAA